MSRYTFHKSGQDRWSSPRPWTDANDRRQRYGRIRPLERPNLIERLFGLA